MIPFRPSNRTRSQAFTILEVMVALFIFGLVLIAIYATWSGIVKGTRSGGKAAMEVQRSRMAMKCVEDALLTAVMFQENMKWYYFVADTKGDMAALSFVARLPGSFPGVGRFGDFNMRRVSFYTQPGADGKNELVMSQVHMLLNTNNGASEGYSLTLARDVSRFELAFYDIQKKEWLDEWKNTNALPALVQVTLGMGGGSGVSTSGKIPEDIVTRVIALSSLAIGGVQAVPTGPVPGSMQGQPFPGGIPPGGIPPGGIPPGGGFKPQ